MKLFNLWALDGIQVEDPGLVRYINLKPIIIPCTGGRNIKIKFHKSKNNIVERLINKLMVPGHRGKKHKVTSKHCTGKAVRCYNITRATFKILENRLKKNPVEVLVRAIENAAPREEINTIEYGGARYPQAVECAPQRRVDLALKHLIHGAYNKSFNSRRKIEESLAEEVMDAYNCSTKSFAITKKRELEKQADASR